MAARNSPAPTTHRESSNLSPDRKRLAYRKEAEECRRRQPIRSWTDAGGLPRTVTSVSMWVLAEIMRMSRCLRDEEARERYTMALWNPDLPVALCDDSHSKGAV